MRHALHAVQLRDAPSNGHLLVVAGLSAVLGGEVAVVCSKQLVCSSPSSSFRCRICARRTAGESCVAISS